MLFVREALEQATHEDLARYHASSFPTGVLVGDLTTGIGADLIALAARGPAIGYELDAERAAFARHNVAVHGFAAEVRVGDSLATEWDFKYVFADPARRVSGKRTLDAAAFSPDPVAVAARFRELRLGVMKLSPMLDDGFLKALGPRVEFVSFGGECREALVFSGSEALGAWGAVQAESGDVLSAGGTTANKSEPEAFFFDCDPAAVRAHALGTLGARFGLALLGDSNGYLTGREEVSSPWLRPYRVLRHGRADGRETRAALRELEATAEVKVRAPGFDGESLRKSLGAHGPRRLSVAVWPIGKSLRHTILEPLRHLPRD